MVNKWFRTKHLSKDLQDKLFSLGYRWGGGTPLAYRTAEGEVGIALNLGLYLSIHPISVLEHSLDMLEVSEKEATLSPMDKEFWEDDTYDWFYPPKEKPTEEKVCTCPMTWKGIIHVEVCHLFEATPKQPWGIPREEEK